jgi:hypothetical protein
MNRYESTIIAVHLSTGEWEVRMNGWDDIWNRRVRRYGNDVAQVHTHTTTATPAPAHLNGIERKEINILAAFPGATHVATTGADGGVGIDSWAYRPAIHDPLPQSIVAPPPVPIHDDLPPPHIVTTSSSSSPPEPPGSPIARLIPANAAAAAAATSTVQPLGDASVPAGVQWPT